MRTTLLISAAAFAAIRVYAISGKRTSVFVLTFVLYLAAPAIFCTSILPRNLGLRSLDRVRSACR